MGFERLAPIGAALAVVALWLGLRVEFSDPELDVRVSSYVYDFVSFYRPNAATLGERLARGDLPLWNPHQGLGQPFLANLQVGALYPPNWLHAVLPTQAAFALLGALHLALAAAWTAALARQLGAGAVGALCAGVLFGASASLADLVWAQPVLYAAAWMPAVLWATARVPERPGAGRAAALALAIALQILCGWPYVVAMTGLAAALLSAALLGRSWIAQRRAPLRAAAWLGGAALLGVLLAAPQLLPSVELVGESCRAVGSIVEAQAVFVDAQHEPARFFAQLGRLWRNDAVPSLPALALALAGLILRPSVRSWALLAAGALTLAASFPNHLPVYGWLREVPVLGDFRFPFRYRLATHLVLSVLAGAGVSALAGLVRARAASTAVAAVAAAAAIGPAFYPRAAGLPGFPVGGAPVAAAAQIEDIVRPATDEPWSRVLWTRHAQKIGAPEGVGFLSDLEPLTLARTAQAITFFQVGKPLTVDVMHGAAPSDAENVNAPFYGRIVLPARPERAALLDALGVDLVVTKEPYPWLALRYRIERARGEESVYRNPRAVPRAYRVESAEPAPPQLARSLGRIAQRSFDPHRSAILDPLPAHLPRTEGEERPSPVRVERWEPENIQLATSGASPGAVVVTDAWYPGWRAWVDGEPVPVLRANEVFRAVAVPAGEHRVEMRYRPTSFRAGLGLFGLAVAALAALLLLRRRPGRSAAVAALCAAALGCGETPPRHVLLVSADSLRADRLGAYGSELGLTPRLDALAAESEVFRFAYTPVPFTLAAATALLTGRHPGALSVWTNATAPTPGGRMLAVHLREAGWDTGAVVSSWHLRRAVRLAVGFDFYDDGVGEPRPDGSLPERSARDTTDAALSMLERMDRLRGAGRFLWVHYQGPPEIRYLDAEVGRLLDSLDERGVLDGAVVVFAGAHGESPGEGAVSPAPGRSLRDAELRVPLLLRVPGRAPGVREETVTLLDVAPTIAALAGVPFERGRDLSKPPLGDAPVYLSTYGAAESPQRGLLSGAWKYVRGTRPRDETVYRIGDDAAGPVALEREELEELRRQFQALDGELAPPQVLIQRPLSPAVPPPPRAPGGPS